MTDNHISSGDLRAQCNADVLGVFQAERELAALRLADKDRQIDGLMADLETARKALAEAEYQAGLARQVALEEAMKACADARREASDLLGSGQPLAFTSAGISSCRDKIRTLTTQPASTEPALIERARQRVQETNNGE